MKIKRFVRGIYFVELLDLLLTDFDIVSPPFVAILRHEVFGNCVCRNPNFLVNFSLYSQHMAYVFWVFASLKILFLFAKLSIWHELSLSFLHAIIQAQEIIKFHVFVVEVSLHIINTINRVLELQVEDTILWVYSVASRFQKLFSP